MFRKYRISCLDKNWNPIINKRIKVIPRQGELIFVEETSTYYKVINIIYYLNKKRGIFIIVDEFNGKKE